jgi:SAM-dependent methyltransferase
MQAGMVHTLREIHRVLKPKGTMIDLRPNLGGRIVNVVLSSAILRAGEVDSSRFEPNKYSANHAIEQVVADRLFKLEYDEVFDLMTDLDTVDDLREFGESLHQDILADAVIEQVEKLTADETEDFSIRIRRPMMIARYRRI